MDLELQKTDINESVVISSVAASQNLDTQLSLPDYCSDIKRILKCTVEPGISNVSLKGERLSATGGVVVRLIYVGEDDTVDCYETETDLSVMGEIKNPPQNALVFAKAKTDYINCRATSQRRVSVSGNIGVNFIVYSENKREVISDCKNKGMQVRKVKVKARNLVCQGEKSFDLGETVSIDNDKPDIGKIVCTTGYCIIDSHKAVAGKLLIKGELCCDIVYCTQKDDSRLCKVTHTMPVNQIIDLAGIDEKSLCDVSAKLLRLMVNVKPDSTGKNRLLELAAKVCAFVKCNCVKEFEAVDDCYSTEGEINGKFENYSFFCPAMKIENEKQVRKTVDFSKGIKDILYAWPLEATSKVSAKKDSALVFGSILVALLYKDDKDNITYSEKTVDYEFQEKMQGEAERYSGECDCIVKNITCEMKGKESAEINAEIKLSGEVLSVAEHKLCAQIDEDSMVVKETQNPALIVCFSQKGEKIWDMAKKYSTTVKAICEENGISGDVLSEAGMIIIPSV